MVITYHGDNYFRIQSGEITILLDPTNQRSFKGADLILSTLRPADVKPLETDEGYYWIDHQGEYEIKTVGVRGWSAGYEDEKEKTIYRINLDDISVVAFGHLTQEPDSKIQEHLKNADCVIIPGGGKPWLGTAAAAKLIRQIEPMIVIPSFSENIKPFLKEFSQEKCEPEEKLTLKKKNLAGKTMVIKCLKP